ALEGRTPYKAWTGRKPDVSHFREFGSDMWVLDESKGRSKLEPKSAKMVFVGFMEGSKAVRYWDRRLKVVKVSRNFAFNENEELKGLEVAEVPGLEAEGEISVPKDTPSSQTLVQPTLKETEENSRVLRVKN